MEKQKIFFAGNIKFLRERRKISQEALAEKLNISRAKLAALELGQTKAPQPEDYLHFSEFFTISIDSLLKVDLAKLGELKLRELEAGNDVYMAGGNIRILALTVDHRGRENVEFVPVKAKAGYMAGHTDPEFIATLPRYSFPDLPKNGPYRMFPITGDSMLPIPDGSKVLAKYLENMAGIKPKTLCIVILKTEQDIVFKQVTLNGREFLMESFNEAYKPYTVPVSEVLQIWTYHSYWTTDIPERFTDQGQLLRIAQEIRDDVKTLMK